jgi:histidinol-phosphatase (PHP family)
MLKELGGRFTLSDDCHGPGAVANNYHLLLEYLKKTGVTEIYYLKRGEAGIVEAIKVENIQDHTFWAALNPAEL